LPLPYAAFEIPSGALGDRYGPRQVLTHIALWWSAFTAFTGLTSNYWLLLAIRFSAKDRKLRFPLLSDFEPKGDVAKSYGAYRYSEGPNTRRRARYERPFAVQSEIHHLPLAQYPCRHAPLILHDRRFDWVEQSAA
jgi:hypothetical protein